MPMMSFSCCREQLMSGTKIETTRIARPHRVKELEKAKANDRPLFCWWKPRTPEKAKLFDAHIVDLSMVSFLVSDGGVQPFHISIVDRVDGEPFRYQAGAKYTDQERTTYWMNEGFDSFEEFLKTLGGKNPSGILGVPMIRIRFKNPNANWAHVTDLEELGQKERSQ